MDDAPAYPPPVGATEKERLLQAVKDWTAANGLTVRPPPALVPSNSVATGVTGILATSAPVTLFPSPFPRPSFEQARSVQKPYNELYARITQDEDFLARIFAE
jgi:glutathione synthase